MKTKTHILLVALTSTVLACGNAHALDFSAAKKFLNSTKTTVTTTLHESNAKAYEYASKAADATDKRIVAELPTTSTSTIKLQGNVPSGSQWILFEVSKENFKDQVIIKVDDTKYEKNLPIKGGAGTYKINVFASADQIKASNNYKYVSEHKIVNTDTRDMKYLLPTEYAQSDDQRIIQVVQQITSGADTDAEKISKIYEYVTETVKYDYDAFYKGTYINKAYDAVTALESSLAFCSGYSNLVAALSRAAGIKARVIMGKIEREGQRLGHAWNEVFVDGEWRILDSTWDIDRVEHKYFFISKEQFANDHFEGVVNDMY